MKKLIIILYTYLPFVSFSQDFSGIWTDSTNADFSNCTAIFSVSNDSVFMAHYLKFKGNSFIEHGSGIIKNNQVEYTVNVTLQVPGWTATKGYHKLTLSKDANTLRGTYVDNSGNTGNLVFKRKYPKLETK